MDKSLLRKFHTWLEQQEGEDYFLATLVVRAAPTIRGVKPATLTSFSARGKNLYDLFKGYGDVACVKLGLECHILKDSGNHCQVLLVNRSLIGEVLSTQAVRALLLNFGYPPVHDLAQDLAVLKTRMAEGFPHEIGVFLGIPPEDVKGFIAFKGGGALLRRYWKVYHDPQKAQKVFHQYDRSIMEAISALIV